MGLVNLDTKASFEEDDSGTVRVVICGEVNSGKSTVLNGLLRQKILPDFFGEAQRPYIFVSKGESSRCGILRDGGDEETVETFEGCDFSDSSMCVVVSEHDHLAGFEIVEVPYLNEKHIDDDVVELVASADILIWTTIASQAWRLSEKTILDKLENRPKHAVLAVSRADKLRSDADRERMRERLARETPDYFEDIVFFHGASKNLEKAVTDDDAWQTTAAPKLAEILGNLAETVRENREASPSEAAAPVAKAPTNVVSLHVAPREPQPKAEPSRPTPSLISQKSADALIEVLGAMHGHSTVGVSSMSDPSKVDLLHGAEELWGGIGAYCAKTIEVMSQVEPAQSNESLNSQLATRRHQILVQSYPRADICLFMVAGSDRMNSSIARMAFTRLCRSYEVSAM